MSSQEAHRGGSLVLRKPALQERNRHGVRKKTSGRNRAIVKLVSHLQRSRDDRLQRQASHGGTQVSRLLKAFECLSRVLPELLTALNLATAGAVPKRLILDDPEPHRWRNRAGHRAYEGVMVVRVKPNLSALK